MNAPSSNYSVDVVVTRTGGATTFNSVTLTTSTNYSNDIPLDRFSAADVYVAVNTISGTLNTYVQKVRPGLTSIDTIGIDDWVDIISFTAMTAAGERMASIVTAGNAEFAVQRGALTAATIRTTTLGRMWRLRFDLSGAGSGATVTLSRATISFYA